MIFHSIASCPTNYLNLLYNNFNDGYMSLKDGTTISAHGLL